MQVPLKKGEKRRLAITQAAKSFFARLGYDQTSIQQVADEVGVSQTGVLYHFPSKMHLFGAVVTEAFDDNAKFVANMMLPTDSALDRLHNLYKANYFWALKQPQNAQIMLSIFYFATFDAGIRELNVKHRVRASRQRLAEILETGEKNGLFKSAAPIATVAQILHDLVVGSLVNAATTQPVEGSFEQEMAKWTLAVKQLTCHA